MAIANLAIELSANVARFESDLNRANRIAQRRTKQMQKQFAQFAKISTAAAIGVGTALTAMTKRTINTADEVQKFGQRTGLTAEFISEMRGAVQLAGVEFSTLTSAIGKAQKSIGDASNGLSTQIRAFEQLGLNIEQLRKLSPERQFEEMADALSKVRNESQRTQLARDIFGRSGQELLSLFKDGKEGIRAMRQEMAALGITMSQDMVDAAAEVNDNLSRLKFVTEGLFIAFTNEILPTLVSVSSAFVDMARENDKTTESFAGTKTVIKTVAAAFIILKNLLEAVAKTIVGLGNTIIGTFRAIFSATTGFTKALGSAVDELKEGNFKAATKSLLSVGDETVAAFNRAKDQIATGLKFIKDEAGGELTEGLENALKVLADPLPRAMKKTGDSAKKAGVDFQNMAKDVEKAKDKIEDFIAPARAIALSLAPQLEQLKAEFLEQRDALEKGIRQAMASGQAYDDLTEALKRNEQAYADNVRALVSILDPYKQFISDLEFEESLLGKTFDQRQRAIIQRDLERQGIMATAEELERVLNVQRQLAAENTVFGLGQSSTFSGQGINSFQQLLADAIENAVENGIKAGFKQLAKAFKDEPLTFISGSLGLINEFKRLTDSGDSNAKAIAKLASTFEGTVVGELAQVALAIDELSGGKLFGTAFETIAESTRRQITLGPTGVSGQITATQSREKALFGGQELRQISEDIAEEFRIALLEIVVSIKDTVRLIARDLGTEFSEVIETSFTQFFDENGDIKPFGLTEIISGIFAGLKFDETFEQFEKRLLAFNLAEVLDQVFDGFGEFIQGLEAFEFSEFLLPIVELYTKFAEDLSEGTFLLAEDFEILSGLIWKNQQAGESLIDTYVRLRDSAAALDEAQLQLTGTLAFAGRTTKWARAKFAELAAGIADAVGGIDEMERLFDLLFDTFLTDAQRTTTELSAAIASRDSLLSGLGVGIEDFWQAMNAGLESMTAEDIAAWLQAGEAIADVMELERERAAQIRELQDLTSGGLSDFQIAVRGLRRNLEDSIKRANQLGASERELAMIREHSERQMRRLIDELNISTAQLILDLFDTADQQVSQIDRVADANAGRYEAELAAIERIRDFADSLLLSNLSILTPGQQLAEARRQFETTLAGARGGNQSDLSNLQGSAQSFLSIARDFFASSPEFTEIFNQVQSGLRSLTPSVSPTIALNNTLADTNSILSENNSAMQGLRDQIASFERAVALQQLFQNLVDLASQTQQTVGQVAEGFGIDIDVITEALRAMGIDPGLFVDRSFDAPLVGINESIEQAAIQGSEDSTQSAEMITGAVMAAQEESSEHSRQLSARVEAVEAAQLEGNRVVQQLVEYLESAA